MSVSEAPLLKKAQKKVYSLYLTNEWSLCKNNVTIICQKKQKLNGQPTKQISWVVSIWQEPSRTGIFEQILTTFVRLFEFYVEV